MRFFCRCLVKNKDISDGSMVASLLRMFGVVANR